MIIFVGIMFTAFAPFLLVCLLLVRVTPEHVLLRDILVLAIFLVLVHGFGLVERLRFQEAVIAPMKKSFPTYLGGIALDAIGVVPLGTRF